MRIVRAEPDSAGGVTVAAREAVAPPKAERATEQEPAAAVGEDEADGEENQSKDVQGLFARLRENRDQATRAARKTLRDTGDEQTGRGDFGPG